MRPQHLCVFALFSSVAFGQTVAPNKTDALAPETETTAVAPLPIEKVILYKNGVGYFEHLGKVSGNQDFEISAVDQEIKTRQQALGAIDHDQARLRENMKALRGSPEEKALLRRYTGQLDEQEDQLASLQKQIAEQKSNRVQMQSNLDAMVQQIAIDQAL